jgi:hypothetical protein
VNSNAAAARLFRLLGLHCGPDGSAPAAASLAGVGAADPETAGTVWRQALRILDQLAYPAADGVRARLSRLPA